MVIINNVMITLKGIISSFMHQGILGWGICVLIAVIVLKNSKKSKGITLKYEELSNTLENGIDNESEEEVEFENDTINKIVKAFKRSTKNGTSDVNTEVIIEKNLYVEEVLREEKNVKNAASVCIAAGLLGTFLGLTIAITQTRGVLGDALGSTRMFGKAMEAPFGSMSAAFWTSIVGVLSSLKINSLNINMERAKDRFYDNMEDYLDNTIYAKYAVNLISQFNKFNQTVETTMKQLTGEITYLFREGVETLVSDINKNNLDLTSTVQGLTKYTKDLERLTSSLDRSVNNFKEPVDKFKTSIEEYIQSSENSSQKVKETTDKFSDNIEILDKDLRNIEQIINNNKKELEFIGTSLENNLDLVNNRQEKLIDSTKEVLNRNKESQQELIRETQNIGNVYKMLTETIGGFNTSFGRNQEIIGKEITDSMSRQLNNITDEALLRMARVLERVEENVENLNKTYNDVARIAKESNDLNSSTIKIFNEKSNN